MKNIKIISILLIGLVIAGCSSRKSADEDPSDYLKESSSETIESSSYGDDEVFYEPRDGKSAESVDENKAAIENKESANQSKGKIEVIKTSNGNFKVEMTEGWQKVDAKELSDNADISLENKSNDEYYIVLSEAKKDFENFDTFKESVDLSDLGERTNEKKESVEYNGLKGERRTFNATKEGVDIYYMYDLMEGKDYYLQCISWTLNSNKESYEADLTKIMNSLAEMPK
ncbi:hypothetical protein [Candidatus Enterococcus mansonii]|uniref:Lipoprotein n=1 Tax=Candidatus Enterococcus mansonii TaxID=1834181 RepID=A0A242CJ61_9ENTE|nr:hypothetical protein [Enterococcus sp. 4G2_DIV0659]OTO09940.1 hypothetical protein A5880_000623 [Enterococcus sp. 4G2_DIV0659]